MGNNFSTTYLEETPPWDDYITQTWRSERCRELDRLGGLNRPAIARGQSFTAKLQFLAEQVKKQGDVMQEMLLPAPAPKEEAKYTGFVLATEKRAYERMLQEQERERAAKLAAEGLDAAAAAAAAAAAVAVAAAAAPVPGVVKPGSGSTPLPMPKPPPTAEGKSRARRPQVGGGALGVISPTMSAQGYPIAQWRLRLWQARRRVMIIVLTVLRLRRGKMRRRYGNKLDNLGFMIHRVLADDVGRFVEEQRKYASIKEELDGAKQALDDMLCRNSTCQLQSTGVLTEDTSWPGSGNVAVSRQASMARTPSLSAAVANGFPSSPAGGGASGGPRAATTLSVGRLNSRTRASDSGALTAALHSAGVSPMRTSHHANVGGPTAIGPPSPNGPQQQAATLGVAGNGPARLSASGLMVRLFGSGGGGADDSGAANMLTGAASGSPRSSFQNGLNSLLSGGVAGGGVGGGGGGGKTRRISTPGGFGSPGNKDSPPTSREHSITQPGPPVALPSSPSGRRSVPMLPPTPTSVTAQLAGTSAAATMSGGLSSMAARRFNSRSSPASNGPSGHHTGLVTTGAAGPLQARVSVTSAVAAKHGQIMQVQTQIESESNNLKKSSQMLSMYVNRANAAWAEAQAWSTVDASAPGELDAFCYSDQYRIYQADLVRRLRQGSICLQVFAGDDFLAGTEKRPGSSFGPGGLSGGTHQPLTVPSPPMTPHDGGGANGKHGNVHGHANGRSRQLSHFDSADSVSGGGGGGSPGLSAGSATSAVTGPLASLLTLRRRQQHDLWTSDPWELIDRFRPGIMPQTDRIQGPSLGARILCQLVLAVEQLAGAEAKAVMPVLLHINEEQMEEVVQELWSYRFFGLKRENVILVASPLHSGYRFNHELKVFEKEYGSSVAPLGSGYSLLQITWAGEAFIVGPEGAPEVLDMPALTLLLERKVEWLVARRARDLALLSRDAILDVPMLAYCMALKDRSGTGTTGVGSGMPASSAAATGSAGRANILLEVSYAESLVDARALDSFVMTRLGPGGSGTGDGSITTSSSQLTLQLSSRGSGGAPPALSPLQSPSGIGTGGPSTPSGAPPSPSQSGVAAGIASSPQINANGYGYLYYGYGMNVQHHTVPDVASAVIELRLGELGTPKMIESLNHLRGFRDGQVPVGLGRYMLHIPSLPALLPNASALRPKLALAEELVRVSLDLGDITAAPKARTLAVHARVNPGVLLTADDLEKVIPLLQAQDHDLAFRDMLVANRSESQSLNFVASQALSSKSGGQVVVVFVVNNRVSAAAVDAAGLVARPGRDRLHLVTCVSNSLQKADAEELLRAFQKRLLKSMVDTHVEVLIRGMWGLLDMMDNYVTAVEAHMVVMGSEHLTSNDFNYVIGSITLSALKRLHVPVMVVTANSRCNVRIGSDWTPPGCLAGGGAAAAGGPRGPNGDRISSCGIVAAGSGGATAAGGGGGGGASNVVGSGTSGPAGASAGGPGRQSTTSSGLRCLSLVENHARNMLAFLCTRLLDNKRGDRLLLAQVLPTRHLTRQQAASVRRALDNFNLMASGHGFSVNRVLSMEGPLDEMLAEAVGVQHIQVLALALPQGLKTLPPALVNLLRACRGVTLVYKEPIGAKQQQVPRGAFGHGAGMPATTAFAAPSMSASWPNQASGQSLGSGVLG